MKRVIDVLKNKIISLFNNKISFSSIIFDSEIDKTSSVRQNVRLYHVKLGRYTYIARNTLIQNTEIGSFCSISEGCNIGMPSHPTDFISTSPVFLQGSNYLNKNFSNIPFDPCPKSCIGNDVWIGSGVSIKSGVFIGDGAIIGAGALVTKNVEPYAIVGGVPARVLRYRFEKSVIDILEKVRWWNWSEANICKYAQIFDDVIVFTRESLK